jgi:catechol 2,3-dioxygenase-like lactoylglutathione lyase family enzyme
MSDLATRALEFIELLDQGDIEAYVTSLPTRTVEWLRRGHWHGFIETGVGADKRIIDVVTDHRWPNRVAVVMDGDHRRMALRVHFDAERQVTGFGLAEWPLESAFRNIVIGCPREGNVGSRMDQLYAELLGLEPGRLQRPVLNLRGGWSTTRPPRWPDPDYPQQLHLDLFVADLDASEEVALTNGATLLQEADDHKTYADPAGHAFCLYPDRGIERGAVIGRVVIDSASPAALAGFYADFLGMQRVEDSPERVVTAYPDGRLPMLGFQHVPRYVAPRWQDPDFPSLIHLDLHFEDDDVARAKAERLGAARLPGGGSCVVYADPAGHPFCLCSTGQ